MRNKNSKIEHAQQKIEKSNKRNKKMLNETSETRICPAGHPCTLKTLILPKDAQIFHREVTALNRM
jgi:hypothetical protein